MIQVPFLEVCDIQGGTQPPKKTFKYEPTDGYIRLLQIRDFSSDDKPVFVPENSRLKTCSNEDIMIARYGASIGRVLTGKSGAYNVALVKTLPDESKVNRAYLKHYLRSPAFQSYILNLGGRAAQAGFNKADLERTTLPLPSVEEQERIAAILDKVDEIIELRKKAIKNVSTLGHSVFQEMFGNPIDNKANWKIRKLKELSTEIRSGNTPIGGKKCYVDQGVMFLRSQNVWRGRLELDDVVFIDDATHKRMEKTSLKNGDLLVTKTGRINTENSSLGRTAKFTGEDDGANINGHVYLVRPRPEVLNDFLLFILTTPEYRDYIRRVCVGGIDKRQINKEHVEEFPIICPPTSEQEKFLKILENLEKQKQKLTTQLQFLSDLFCSLQHRAFRGEL